MIPASYLRRRAFSVSIKIQFIASLKTPFKFSADHRLVFGGEPGPNAEPVRGSTDTMGQGTLL
jgi:hypothetical protein